MRISRTGYYEEVDDLTREAHDTVNPTNEKCSVSCETDCTVKDVLVVLWFVLAASYGVWVDALWKSLKENKRGATKCDEMCLRMTVTPPN